MKWKCAPTCSAPRDGRCARPGHELNARRGWSRGRPPDIADGMAVRSLMQVKRPKALGVFETQEHRRTWLYTAANLLLLLYLAWAAPAVAVGIIKRETWAVIPLVIAFVYLGAWLIALAPRIRVGPAAVLAFILYVLWGMFA